MSTKSTIRYGRNFHLYHDLMDEDEAVYLRLDKCEFEASSDQVTVRIPLALWEYLRKAPGFTPYLHNKTDQEILDHVTTQVDSRIQEYNNASDDKKPWASFIGSAVYGGADDPRDEQIRRGVEWNTKQRAQERATLQQIAHLELAGKSSESED